MGITYFEKERNFLSWIRKIPVILIGITDEENFIGHIYYGGKNWRIIIWHICSRTEESPMCLR